MSKVKETKKDLEQAEKLIKLKSYSTARIYITKVLTANPNDFRGLVFRAYCEMAEDQFVEAEETLSSAMENNPGKPLPAVAFINLSDKHKVSLDKLKSALTTVRRFTKDNGDVEKFNLYTEKLLELLVDTKSDTESIKTLLVALTRCSATVELKVYLYLYNNNPTTLSYTENGTLFEHLQQFLLNYSTNLDMDDEGLQRYKIFCTLGNSREKFSQIFNVSKHLFVSSCQCWALHIELLNIILLNYICKFAETFTVPVLGEETVEILAELDKLPNNGSCIKSTSKTIVSALLFMCGNVTVESIGIEEYKKTGKDLLHKTVVLYLSLSSPDPLLGSFILSILNRMRLPLDSTSLKAESILADIENNEKFSSTVKESFHILILYFQLEDSTRNFENSEKTVSLCDQLSEKVSHETAYSLILYTKGCACVQLKQFEKLDNVLSTMNRDCWFWYLLSALADINSPEKVIELCEKGLSYKRAPKLLLLKCKVLLEKQSIDDLPDLKDVLNECETLDPYDCDVHYLFALYNQKLQLYSECIESAVCCYSMNPYHLESVKLHGEVYFRSGNFEKLRTLYRSRLSVFSVEIQHSLWLSLAVRLYKCGQNHLAVECVAQCRMCDRHRYVGWMLVSLIYFQSDSFESSLNCALKSLQLLQKDAHFLPSEYRNNQDLLLSSYLTASSRLALGRFQQANDDFTTCLVINQSFLPILCQVTNCNVRLSNEKWRNCRVSDSQVYLQKAIFCAFEAVRCFPQENMAWKTLGDTLLTCQRYLDEQAFEVPGKLLNRKTKTCRIYRFQLLQLSVRAYLQALTRGTSSVTSEAWKNLSVACFAVATKKYLELCVHYGKIALSLDQYNAELWIYLGSVCSSEKVADYSLAQHCFITAYNLNPDDLNPLCYLGFLYAKTGKMDSAKKVFAHVESLEPSLPLNVLSKQLLVEKNETSAPPLVVVRVLESTGEDASTSQALHLADSILRTPQTDDRTYYTVLNMLATITCHSPDLYLAHYYYGLLLEKKRLLQSASYQYMKAVRCKQVPDRAVIFSALLRCNINHPSALKLFMFSQKTINDKANVALHFYNSSQFDKCLETIKGDNPQLIKLRECIQAKISSHEKSGVCDKVAAKKLLSFESLFYDGNEVCSNGIISDSVSTVWTISNYLIRFQRLYLLTLNPKFLCYTYLHLVSTIPLDEMPDMSAKFVDLLTPEGRLCSTLCHVSSSLKSRDCEQALVDAQRLVLTWPWLTSHWQPLLYCLRCCGLVAAQDNNIALLANKGFSALLAKFEKHFNSISMPKEKSHTVADSFVFPDMSKSFSNF